ncbi:MAG TPA: hypothetical protein VHC98_00115 [Candidatus Saccharimonadales bacterium]|nr:hypothetical protein [Candidatus Saccharimonadales bacterium]
MRHLSPEHASGVLQAEESRRAFLRSAGQTAKLVLVLGAFEMGSDGLANGCEALQVAQRLENTFMALPSDEQLAAQSFNATRALAIPASSDVRISAFGDSMNLVNGVRESGGQGDPFPPQPGSWAEVLAGMQNNMFRQLHQKTGRPVGTCQAVTYAYPGSTTRGLDGAEAGYGGNVQLGNPDIQHAIVHDPALQIITIGENGNNWQRSGHVAVNLYEDTSRPVFRQFLDILATDSNGFWTKARAWEMLAANPGLRRDVNMLMDVYEQDVQDYAAGITRALQMVADLNHRRIAQALPELSLIVTQPIELAFRNVVPQTTVVSRGGYAAAGPIRLNDVPAARPAVRGVVTDIYRSTAEALKDATRHLPTFPKSTITVPLLGLEQNQSLFFRDGHLNAAGQRAVADRVAARLALVGA